MVNKKIILLGAYGQDNLGDEALLEAILSKLKTSEFNISANSMNPVKTSRRYSIGTFYTPLKKNFWIKLKKFFTASAVLYGGGTLLVELRMVNFSRRLPLYRGFIINLLSKLMGKKIVYIGIGVEPVSGWFSKFLLKSCVKMSDLCYVRDKESLILLRDYGCPSNKIFLGADPVFLFSRVKKHKQNNAKKKILILPVYRILEFGDYHKQYVSELVKYALEMSKRGNIVEFYSMSNYSQDSLNDKYMLSLIQKYIGKNKNISFKKGYMRPKTFAEYLLDFDLVLSSRFHGLVFAAINSIPIISLSNYRKCESLMNDLGLSEFSLTSKEVISENLIRLTDRINKLNRNITSKINDASTNMNFTANRMLELVKLKITNQINPQKLKI